MKKKIALLFTDLHLNSLNKDVCLNYIEKLIDYSKKNKIKDLIFLGDFFDCRKGQDEPTLTTASKIIERINEENLSLISFPGNHDKFISSSLNSYLDVYKDKLALYKEVSCINMYFDYYIFPYFENEIFDIQLNKLINLVSSNKSSNKKILLGHYMYEQLPQELTKYFDKIFLGHNHERNSFPKGEYIGSCIQQGFCEDNSKGFSVLYDDLSTELIKFEEKEYITQKININCFSNEEIYTFINKFIASYPNKYLRIELIGYNKETNLIKEYCKKNGINVVSRVDNNTINDKENVDISEITKEEISKHFSTFCKSQNINKDIEDLISNYFN